LQPQRFGVVDGGFRADEKTGFVILKAYGSMAEVKKGLATHFMFYNENDGIKTLTGRPRLWFISSPNRRDRLQHEHEPGAASYL